MSATAKSSLVVLILLLLAGVASAQEVTNKTCPVMEGEEVDPEISTVYKGKKILFCCDDCVETFNDDPESYLADLPQFAEPDAGHEPEGAGEGEKVPAGEGEGTGEDRDEAEGENEHEHAAEGEAAEDEDHALGALHPMAVHFPVALAMVAALAAILGLLFRGAFLRNGTTFSIVLAGLFSIPAFLLGEPAEEALGRMSESREAAVGLHETWGTVTMYALLGVALLHLIARWKSESSALKWLSFFAILAAAGLVGYAGYLGGEVVRPGHLGALLP